VALLCGGLGLRQRTDVDDLSKPLRPLPDGRPLLVHVIEYYRRHGMSDFVLCVGYQAAAVRDMVLQRYGVLNGRLESGGNWVRLIADDIRLTLVDSGPEAEKSARLLAAGPHLGNGRFLLGYSDVLSDFDLARLLRQPDGALVTLVATRVRSRYGELTLTEDARVASFREKPLLPALISAGYFLCAPGLLSRLSPQLAFEEELLPQLAAQGQLQAVVHTGRWFPFDTYKDFIDADEFAAKEYAPWLS
jgi:glucose-1-phosphate cytidylyltransferase